LLRVRRVPLTRPVCNHKQLTRTRLLNCIEHAPRRVRTTEDDKYNGDKELFRDSQQLRDTFI
jgi:hypothetical protein